LENVGAHTCAKNNIEEEITSSMDENYKCFILNVKIKRQSCSCTFHERMKGGIKVQLHTLTLALDGVSSQHHTPAALHTGKGHLVPTE